MSKRKCWGTVQRNGVYFDMGHSCAGVELTDGHFEGRADLNWPRETSVMAMLQYNCSNQPERVRDGRGVALINFEPFSFSVESAVYFKFDTSLASAKYTSHSEPHANFTPFIVSFKLKTKYLNTL